jgi:hypothetical protein
VNDAVYCNCMPRKDGLGQTLERNALQRIAILTKDRLAWICLFAFRVNEGRRHPSVPNPMGNFQYRVLKLRRNVE